VSEKSHNNVAHVYREASEVSNELRSNFHGLESILDEGGSVSAIGADQRLGYILAPRNVKTISQTISCRRRIAIAMFSWSDSQIHHAEVRGSCAVVSLADKLLSYRFTRDGVPSRPHQIPPSARPYPLMLC
jgi:hypothetical protein